MQKVADSIPGIFRYSQDIAVELLPDPVNNTELDRPMVWLSKFYVLPMDKKMALQDDACIHHLMNAQK